MAKETAEQKLLKIIENTEKSGAPPAQAGAPAPTAGAAATATQPAKADAGKAAPTAGATATADPRAAAVADAVKSGAVVADQPASGFKLPVSFLPGFNVRSIGLKEVNRILMVVAAVMSLFFVIDFLRGMNYSKQTVQIESDKSFSKKGKINLPVFKEINDYLDVIAQRNIFIPFEKKEETLEAQAASPVRQIESKTKNLKLVGISWLDSPETASALIENTDSGGTYFLKNGEKLNEVSVKQIFSESVVLEFQGEELELRL